MRIGDWFKKNRANKDGEFPWTHQLTHYYIAGQVCIALEQAGVFELLRSQKKVTPKDIAQQCALDETMLKTCLDYLWVVSPVLRKNDRYFSLNTEEISETLWGFVAYKAVFDNLEKLLNGSLRYGNDIKRDGYFLQRASEKITESAISTIIRILGEDPRTILVDLGCGSGRSLISFCQSKAGRRGVGLDIEPDIIKQAAERAKSVGLDDQISFIETDALDIERWSAYFAPPDRPIFLASTMLHELLRTSEHSLVLYLKQLKDKFAGSRFFIIEVDAPSFEDLKNENNKERKLFVARYKLFHPLTNQGMPQPRSAWERIIKEAGWNIRGVYPAYYYLTIYDCEL